MDSGWRLLIDFVIIAILILGIRQFKTPRGARTGNLAAALAFLCALGVVWHSNPVTEPVTVVLALAAGGSVGWLVAMRVSMIQIPAMVAFQHGAGGIAAFVTALVELTRDRGHLLTVEQFSGVLGIIIGAATFSGSMVASAKLAGVVRQTPTYLPKHNWILAANLAAIMAFGVLAAATTGPLLLYGSLLVILLSILLGAVFAIRIGGADMPVLISFLNATAGLAAAFCGIIIENRLLVACGATVAASGSVLTHVMCQAMNRNLLNVLVATDWKPESVALATGEGTAAPRPSSVASQSGGSPGQTPLLRAVEAATSARKIIVVPGYGMALAHAQFEVVKVANRLKELGKEVKFAIHPIAGRMPGHMHVLLAEAEAESDMLFDLPEINSEFQEADLALVVGACDVVNPAAINVEGSPISGMPILAAYEAKQVLVCNLDDRPGYSGVQNPLYANPKTILMFGDAKATLSQLLRALN